MAVEGAKGKIVEGKKKVKPTTKRKMSKVSPKAKAFLETKDEEGRLMFTNEMLVDIVNAKRSKQEDKFGAVEALIEKNWPVISKALKFNPSGDITMESIKTAISEQMTGIFPKITLPNGQTVKGSFSAVPTLSITGVGACGFCSSFREVQDYIRLSQCHDHLPLFFSFFNLLSTFFI